jgi:1,4-alpha-glucan branching enzyme
MDLSRLERVQKVYGAGARAAARTVSALTPPPDRVTLANASALHAPPSPTLRLPVAFEPPAAPPAAAPLKTITFTFDGREGPKLANVALKGSFDPATGRYDPQWNGGRTLPMFDDGTHGDEKAGDGVYTAQVALDPTDPSSFQWGAQGDVLGEDGRPVQTSRWLMLTEEPPQFKVGDKGSVVSYAPVSNPSMGVHRVGEDGVAFKTWSPELGRGELADYHLQVELFDDDGHPLYALPMEKDERTGMWSAQLPQGWSQLQGKAYRYAARNPQGQILTRHFADGTRKEVAYADPYARYLQGPERGVERINVDPVLGIETGWYDSSSSGGPDYSVNPLWGRFTVPGHMDADRVTMQLQDEQGRPLTKQQLLERLGPSTLLPYDQASERQKQNVDILRRWQTDVSSPVTRYAWLDHVHDDGTIDLAKVGDEQHGGSWVATVNNFPALVGLRCQFSVYRDGRLVGDENRDGVLQAAEARKTPFNDPYSAVITAHPGAERLSLIKQSSYQFRFDDVPRKETDFRKFVIFEAHVGSFMGSPDNAHASSFEDVIKHLDYVEKLGANTIELLPVQEFGGERDWGYTPDFMFAGADAYGFEMSRDQAVSLGLVGAAEQTARDRVWVSGTDAFKLLVDEAHRRGLNVVSDVVYNHVAGRPDAENPLELIDGDKESFFKWGGQSESQTPWGAKPNYAAPAVKNLYTDNAAQQLTEFHVDGMRFDFVQVLHDTGSVDEKREGMNTLRQINRTLQFLRPGVYTVAEDFTHNWLVAADLDKSEWQGDGQWRMEKRGMGFGGVWNDSFHHTLLGNIEGQPGYDMDNLMGALTHHYGVTGWDRAVVFSHSHDEVGNSGRWVLRAAAHSVKEQDVMASYPRAMGRTAAALTLTSAGVPMIWQGEEQLANNDFKHAMPQTWGTDLGWLSFPVTPDRFDVFKQIAALPADQKSAALARLSPEERPLFERFDAMPSDSRQKAEYDADKNGMHRLYHDLIALRTSSPGLCAATPIQSLYTHNADRVLAYSRSDRFAVISNFDGTPRDNYDVHLPAGRWKVVLNTDDRVYGGAGSGAHGIVEGGRGIALPGGGTVVLERVS